MLKIDIKKQSSLDYKERICDLAHKQNLSSYDAAYLDLAIHRGVEIASLDVALKKNATKLGVELLQFS